MKKLLPVILCLIALPAVVLATEDCLNCRLGLFDSADINHANNSGTMGVGTPKEIYLGLQLAPGETGVTGIEFSIAGMRTAEDGILVVGADPLVPAALQLGSVPAPADTSAASTGIGGQNVGWSTCLSGSQMLLKLTILSFSAQTNKVFRIMHKFPASNPVNFPNDTVLTRCDGPTFTTVRIKRPGCYVANWDGTSPVPCPLYNTPVQAKTWGAVKTLYSN